MIMIEAFGVLMLCVIAAALWRVADHIAATNRLLRWIGRDFHRLAEAQKPSGNNLEPPV